jgi:hypothetical protein
MGADFVNVGGSRGEREKRYRSRLPVRPEGNSATAIFMKTSHLKPWLLS